MTNITETRTKGALVWAQAVGNSVELWYASPTGDSSDSFIHRLPCLSEAQAEAIAETHKQVWGL